MRNQNRIAGKTDRIPCLFGAFHPAGGAVAGLYAPIACGITASIPKPEKPIRFGSKYFSDSVSCSFGYGIRKLLSQDF
jgi:hypothetical protein